MTDAYDPASYWDTRYRSGGDSGAGSRGDVGYAKAQYVNRVIRRYVIESVIDWGCGDGQVLAHITPDIAYLGVDVSPTILSRVQQQYPQRAFCSPADAVDSVAELALSMDVLLHLPDDHDYQAYLERLFTSATRHVLVYATDYDGGRTAHHVRRRQFTPDITIWFPEWCLIEEDQECTADDAGFYLYGRRR